MCILPRARSGWPLTRSRTGSVTGLAGQIDAGEAEDDDDDVNASPIRAREAASFMRNTPDRANWRPSDTQQRAARETATPTGRPILGVADHKSR